MIDRLTYRTEITVRAAHDLERLPEKVARACLAFIFTDLTENPTRVSKPLLRELTGLRSA